MPQARTAGTRTSKSTTAKRTPAKSTAAKPAAAKSATAKPAAAKPAAAKSAAAKPAATRAAAAKPAAAKSATAKPAAKRPAAKSAAKPAAAKSAATAKPAASSRPRVNIDAAQVEAVAERLRKLNEKIIEVGREAGESTLASYEKALKTIASGVQQSPAKDEIEWIQHLAASQAKFVREITDSWAKAARERLK
jgi:hypothetical protein